MTHSHSCDLNLHFPILALQLVSSPYVNQNSHTSYSRRKALTYQNINHPLKDRKWTYLTCSPHFCSIRLLNTPRAIPVTYQRCDYYLRNVYVLRLTSPYIFRYMLIRLGMLSGSSFATTAPQGVLMIGVALELLVKLSIRLTNHFQYMKGFFCLSVLSNYCWGSVRVHFRVAWGGYCLMINALVMCFRLPL